MGILRKLIGLSAPAERSLVLCNEQDNEEFMPVGRGPGLSFPAVVDRSTGLASSIDEIPAASRSVLESRPDGESTAVYFGQMSAVYHYGPGEIVGSGHIVGRIGIVDNLSAAGVAGGYAVEGRVQSTGAGGFDFTASFIPAVQSVTDGAVGGITVHADYYSPLLADHEHITAKFSLLNDDPDKPIRTAGVIESPCGEVIPRARVGVAPGRYYPIEGVTGLFPGTAISRGVLTAAPIVVPKKDTYTRIGFTLGTGVADCTARLGLFRDADGVPGELVFDAGTVLCGTGDAGAREIVIDKLLDAGIYWIAIQPEGGASDPGITWASVNAWSVIGMSAATAQDSCAVVANTGELPAEIEGAALTGGGFAPFLWLRKAV